MNLVIAWNMTAGKLAIYCRKPDHMLERVARRPGLKGVVAVPMTGTA
jgi:hypothetical protein